jgi:hypothetical protein
MKEEEGVGMPRQGFVSHSLMGAAVLCGAWVAIYLPHIIPGVRVGGISEVIAIAAGVIGALGAPALLIIIEGDEIFGILGIVAALLAGWISARIGIALEASASATESARLCGAALGPIVLYTGFSVPTWVADRRERSPSTSSRDKED